MNRRLDGLKSSFVSVSEARDAIRAVDDEFLVYVVFIASEADRDLSYLRFPVPKGWKVYEETDPACKVWRFRLDYEMKKAIIAVDATKRPRANLLCILRGIAVGVGLIVNDKYDKFAELIETSDDNEFLKLERGLARIVMLHTREETKPGMSRVEVEAALSKLSYDDFAQ